MPELDLILIATKYAVAGGCVLCVWMFPAWLARQNKKPEYQMGLVRFASFMFGWTGVGWVIALYWAARK